MTNISINSISNENLETLYQCVREIFDSNCYRPLLYTEDFIEYKNKVIPITGEELFYSAVNIYVDLFAERVNMKKGYTENLKKLKDKSVNEEEKKRIIGNLFYRDFDTLSLLLAIPLLFKIAEHGHVEAQFLLGQLFFLGFVDDDYRFGRKRQEVYKKIRIDKDDWSCKNVLKYFGIQNNPKIAYKWFLKAAEQGHCDAQYAVGEYLLLKAKSIKDYEKAADWILKSGECKRDTYMKIGRELAWRISEKDIIGPISKKEDNKLFQSENKQECLPVIDVAKMYFNKAKEYYDKGFLEEIKNSKDLKRTYFIIALYCLNGSIDGEEENSSGFVYYTDFDNAVKYFTKAAEVGNYEAMIRLGNLYYSGSYAANNSLFNFCDNRENFTSKLDLMQKLGITTFFAKQHKKAEEWFLKIYEKKDTAVNEIGPLNIQECCECLGYIYLYGNNGIKVDENKAAKWLFRACNLYESTETGINYLSLGDRYFYGEMPVPEDYERAYECYSKAALLYSDHKKAEALKRIGELYSGGYGVEKESAIAKKMFDKAMQEEEKIRLKEPSYSRADDYEGPRLRYGVSMGSDGNYYDEYGDYVPDDCAYEDD